MSLYEPIDQGRADCLLNLWLLLHVVGVRAPFGLGCQHIALNLGTELGYMIHIVDGGSIVLGQLPEHLRLPSLVEHGQLLVHRDMRQLFRGVAS